MNERIAPPVRCETLAEIVERFGGKLDFTASEIREDYALPLGATAEMKEFFRGSAGAVVGPSFVARLPQGRVYRAGIVLSPDGASIARDVSLDFGKTAAEHWLMDGKSLRAPVFLSGETAVVASTLASGYSHWLLDELPRLLALKVRESDGRLIAHSTHEFARTALRLRGWRGEVIEPRDGLHVQCEELVVPSLVGSVEAPTWRGTELINDFAAPLQAESSFGERLFLTREKARRRRITNESQLWAELETRGFRKLQLEELSWQDQINAFRQAKVIVAPHGAGLANLAFCRPGTQVVELFNREYVNRCYWRLATVRQLDYRPLVQEGATTLADSQVGSRLDLTADVAAVVEAIDGA